MVMVRHREDCEVAKNDTNVDGTSWRGWFSSG